MLETKQLKTIFVMERDEVIGTRCRLRNKVLHAVLTNASFNTVSFNIGTTYQWRIEGGGLGVQTPPEIPKVLQNRAKLNPIVKTVKNC